MKTYNITEGTITLTIDEFRDLAFHAAELQCLINCGVQSWEGWHDAIDTFLYGEQLTFDELTGSALAIMQDEERSDYELMVASEWLHYLPRMNEMKVAEWAAIMRDLEDQLKAIIRKEHED